MAKHKYVYPVRPPKTLSLYVGDDTPMLVAICPLEYLEQSSRGVEEGILDTHTIALQLLNKPNQVIPKEDLKFNKDGRILLRLAIKKDG